MDLKVVGKRLLDEVAKPAAVPAAKIVLDEGAKACIASDKPLIKGLGGIIAAVAPVALAELAKAVGAPAPAVAPAVAAK